MKLKEGASLQGVQWQMFEAAVKIDRVFNDYSHQLTITAGTDGHHGPHSLHYHGLALDIRTREVPLAQMLKVTRDIKLALGPDFDVVQEGDHLHVEFDPRHDGTGDVRLA